MTTYTNINNNQIDTDSPVTQPLMTQMRDNPIAMAEGATGAPYHWTHWHGYDSLAVDDGNDGEFYDFETDGAVSQITSPTFTTGFDYRLFFDDFQSAIGGDFDLEFLFEKGGGFVSGLTYTTGSGPGSFNIRGTLAVIYPFVAQKDHMTEGFLVINTGAAGGASLNSGTATNAVNTITRFRINLLNSRTTSGGRVLLQRRRSYL